MFHKDTMSKYTLHITPANFLHDSRTIKFARYFQDHGFASLVLAENVLVEHLHRNVGPSPVRTISQKPKLFNRGNIRLFLSRFPRALDFPLFVIHVFYWLFRYNIILRIPSNSGSIVLHEFSSFLRVWLHCKLRKAQYWYDAHDLYLTIRPQSSLLRYESRYLYPFFQWVEGLCVKNARIFTTVSNGLADILETQYRRRPFVVRNCAARFTPISRIEPSSYNTDIAETSMRCTLKACIVGNRKEGSELDWIYKLSPDVLARIQFHFFGKNYRSLVGELETIYPGHFVDHGSIPQDLVVDQISRFDFGIVPYIPLTMNYAFALPNGFFQMIAAGVPIIFPKGLTELAQLASTEGLGLEADFLCFPEVSQVLTSITTDPVQLAKFSDAARRSSLDWENESLLLQPLLDSFV